MSEKLAFFIVLGVLALILNLILWSTYLVANTIVITHFRRQIEVNVNFGEETKKKVSAFEDEIEVLIAPSANLCQNISFLMVVHVRANDSHSRDQWRDNYSPLKEKYNFEMLFALGKPGIEENQDDILEEARGYGDILQGNFIDTYHNISYKQLTHLHYINKHCQARFIVKMDDDVVFNVPKFADLLNKGGPDKFTSLNHLTGNKLWCLVWKKAPIHHDGKWNIAKEEKLGRYYPTYCAGMAYFMTNTTVSHLVKASRYVKFFWVDDIFITGYVAREGRTKHVNVPFYMRDSSNFAGFLKNQPIFSLTNRKNTSSWFNELHLK